MNSIDYVLQTYIKRFMIPPNRMNNEIKIHISAAKNTDNKDFFHS